MTVDTAGMAFLNCLSSGSTKLRKTKKSLIQECQSLHWDVR